MKIIEIGTDKLALKPFQPLYVEGKSQYFERFLCLGEINRVVELFLVYLTISKNNIKTKLRTGALEQNFSLRVIKGPLF